MVQFCLTVTIVLLAWDSCQGVGYDWLLWDNGDVGKHVKEPDIDIGSSLLSEETKDVINMPDDREIELYRHKRAAENETTTSAAPSDNGSKSIWEKIEEFYSDNNNMAMYCVLPLLVFVYGGCSAIYCIHKCRRCVRRRKHKRLRNEDDSSFLQENDKNNLNQESDHSSVNNNGEGIKFIGGCTFGESNTDFSEVEQKKTPLPWDTPDINTPSATANQINVRLDSANSRGSSYSTTSADITTGALERQPQQSSLEVKQPQPDKTDNFTAVKKLEDMGVNQMPKVVNKANDFNRLAGSRPIEIVPISKTQYQKHVESNRGDLWDPLHNQPFGDSRMDSASAERKGRESAWSIRDEIMAKYDALTSLAMTKKTADILRITPTSADNSGHRPDTLRRKPKNKLIFIAE